MKNPQERSDLHGSKGRNAEKLPSLIALGNVALIIASLYWAQTILIPIALAIMLTFLLSPVAGALERIGLKRLPSVLLIVVLTFSSLATIGWVVSIEFTSLGNELPNIRVMLDKKSPTCAVRVREAHWRMCKRLLIRLRKRFRKSRNPQKNCQRTKKFLVRWLWRLRNHPGFGPFLWPPQRCWNRLQQSAS